MYQNMRTNPAEAKNYRLFNKDSGKEISLVVMADDVRGRFRQYKTDKKGNFLFNKRRGEVRTILHTGRNIELRKISE